MSDIMLSYSRKDQEKMEQIRDTLRNDNLTVWTDEFLEPGSSNWLKEIEEAIHDSKMVVVVWSPASNESVWVQRELIH